VRPCGTRPGIAPPTDCLKVAADPLMTTTTETEFSARSDRPVLLTVDDDPSVSRAVARDLRRHYGQNNRMLRAGSGAVALDALRELKLRGEQVAALGADVRFHDLLRPACGSRQGRVPAASSAAGCRCKNRSSELLDGRQPLGVNARARSRV
jgi:hypothetical protein